MEEIVLSGRIPEEETRKAPISKIKKEQTLDLIVHFFILLFIYAGLRKLVDLEMFVKEVWGFAIFGSKQLIRAEFIALSCAELFVATLLLIPRTKHLGIAGAFILAVLINVCFFIMQQYAKVIPLYYGGILPSVSFITHFGFNIIILFIALKGVLLQISLYSRNRVSLIHK